MTTEPARILVIRHESGSSLGLLEPIAHTHHSHIRYLNLLQGEAWHDSVADYSHLIVLGGAVSAYEDDRYPALRDEFKLIEQAMAGNIPIVGICLGAQVLAQVLGAKVYRGAAGREVGWCQVQLRDAAAADPLLQDFPPQFRVFQSHQDTFDLPVGAVHLAESAIYPHQCFRFNDRVWAMQFHLEFNETVLADCAAVIEQELCDSQIQDTTLPQLLAESRLHTPAVAPIADRFMQHFLHLGERPVHV